MPELSETVYRRMRTAALRFRHGAIFTFDTLAQRRDTPFAKNSQLILAFIRRALKDGFVTQVGRKRYRLADDAEVRHILLRRGRAVIVAPAPASVAHDTGSPGDDTAHASPIHFKRPALPSDKRFEVRSADPDLRLQVAGILAELGAVSGGNEWCPSDLIVSELKKLPGLERRQPLHLAKCLAGIVNNYPVIERRGKSVHYEYRATEAGIKWLQGGVEGGVAGVRRVASRKAPKPPPPPIAPPTDPIAVLQTEVERLRVEVSQLRDAEVRRAVRRIRGILAEFMADDQAIVMERVCAALITKPVEK